VTPKTIIGLCSVPTSSCTTALSSAYPTNALASYNALPMGTMAAPYQLWSAPQVAKTGLLAAGAANMAALSGFFNSQLNGAAGQVTQSSATSTTSASTGAFSNTTTSTTVNGAILGSTTSPAWQLLGSGSSLSNYNNSNDETYEGMGGTSYGCQLLANGAFYSPSPWSGSGTQTLTEQTASTTTYYVNENINGMEYPVGYTISVPNNPCSTSTYAATPPVSYLLTRPWTQGSTWPPTPVITSTTLTNSGGTSYQLTANYCPAAGCSWGYDGTLPSGWSVSSTGLLTVPNYSAIGSFTAIAGNNYAFGSATVTLPQLVAPVVTSSSVFISYGVSQGMLKASSCGSTCTWASSSSTKYVSVESNGTVVCNWTTLEDSFGEWSGTISVTATNAAGVSAAKNVTVSCEDGPYDIYDQPEPF
jgi:hypothetical protein